MVFALRKLPYEEYCSNMAGDSSNKHVYLDRLIPREPFLYKSSQEFSPTQTISTPRVSLLQLESANSDRRGGFRRQLSKPDFQRATWAWTPEQCVDLLDSLLRYRVVPSVILWLSPDNFIYVLDGGHRISVLLAYMADDWGDKDMSGLSDTQIPLVRQVAQENRFF
jgi:hypothetical protein